MVLKSMDDSMKPKEIPMETFFHKIVMLRDRLRVLEQKINAHSDVVSFIGLPSCFKWYGGGIFIQKQSEIQGKWINSFYNKEQAMKAYKLADKLLSYKYEWPKNERNWLKLNVAVLKQMEVKIDSL